MIKEAFQIIGESVEYLINSVRQWQSHMQKPDPYPPLKHKNKSPMDKRPVKISKENISIKARGKDWHNGLCINLNSSIS